MGWGSGGWGSVPHGSSVSVVKKVRLLLPQVVHFLKSSKVAHFLKTSKVTHFLR